MSQNKLSSSEPTLSGLCRHLSELVDMQPLEQMNEQLTSQQHSNEQNCRWLEEAMQLLNGLVEADNPAAAAKIAAKAESFISKATSDDYHEINPKVQCLPSVQASPMSNADLCAASEDPKNNPTEYC